jgi:putative hydrolase of the HAD superfamily
MTRWIVFDAMGVIFEEGDDILNRLIPFLRRRGCAVGEETVHALYRKASLGLVSCRDFWNGLGLGGQYPVIETEYLDTCLQLDSHLIETAERLAGRYSLAILSNDIGAWSAHLRARHGLDRLFQTAVISSEAGVRKPAPEIYQILLDRLQAEGKDCLFLDDRIPNLAPAAALGFVAVLLAKEDSPESRGIRHRIKAVSELPDLAEKIFSGNPPRSAS